MDIRQFFFKYRGFTPVPIILVVIIFAHPSYRSLLWGLLPMVLGELIRIWGVSYAGGATRTRNVGAPFLVTNGPFSFVRNPLYIGNLLMYSGAAIIANVWLPWLVIAVFLFFLLQYYFIVNLEEEQLTKIFGEEYQDYQRKVPRFLPRLKPAVSQDPVQPDFAGAIKSEKSTFLSFFVIIILLAGKMLIFT